MNDVAQHEMLNALSIDLEDWFHILDVDTAPPLCEWEKMESRVERNTAALLKILERRGARATFFVLGWIAEIYPALVKEIARRGHELASHGYAHKLVYASSPQEFEDDLLRARDLIHAASGFTVQGYRAPGFSINESCLWAFDVLAKNGFTYDSSIFPAVRNHGGYAGYSSRIARQPSLNGSGVWEFPISVCSFLGKKVAFSGGGYLRFWPRPFIEYGIEQINRTGHPAVVYFHPRDLDNAQPRLPMPWKRKWKTYYNLATGGEKLDRILARFRFAPVEQVLRSYLGARGEAFDTKETRVGARRAETASAEFTGGPR